MLITPVQAANHLIIRHQKKSGITETRLHALLYLAHGFGLVDQKSMSPFIFDESPRAYGWGPTYQSLHSALRGRTQADLMTVIQKPIFAGFFKRPELPSNPDHAQHLDWVDGVFNFYEDSDFFQLICKPGRAWASTPILRNAARVRISEEAMRREFRMLLENTKKCAERFAA